MGNTTDIEEKPTTALEKVDEAPQETYHILKFIKENVSTFVAILTGTVAVIAFVLNLFAYVYQRIQLNPWHISGEVIEFWGNQRFLLTFVLEFAYIMLTCAIPVMLSRSFVRYGRFRAILKYWKAWIRWARKERRQANRDIRGIEKNLKKFAAEEIAELSAQMQGTKEKLKDIKTGLRKEGKNYWRMRALILGCIIMICFFAMLMFIPIIIVMLGLTGEIDWEVLLFLWGCAALSVLISSGLDTKRMDTAYAPKAIRQSIEEALNGDNVGERLHSKMKETFEKAKERTTVTKAFSDETIKKLGVQALITMAAIVLALCISGKEAAYQQKEFWIYSDSGRTYAVAYQDGSHCVLKQATVDENEIVIHTGEQLVVSGTMVTSQRTFDKVTFEEYE